MSDELAPAEAPAYLSTDDVKRLRASLTMGDTDAAEADAGGDPAKLAKLAMRRAAVRLGLIPAGTPLPEFLDRLRVMDVQEAFSEIPSPLAGGSTSRSLASAGTGDSPAPISLPSDGTSSIP